MTMQANVLNIKANINEKMYSAETAIDWLIKTSFKKNVDSNVKKIL